jgi:hypothetical protein
MEPLSAALYFLQELNLRNPHKVDVESLWESAISKSGETPSAARVGRGFFYPKKVVAFRGDRCYFYFR